MTPADIADKVRQLERAFNDQDREAMTSLLAPDVEWHPALATARSVYRGPDEVCDLALEEIPSLIEGFRAHVAEIRKIDSDTAVARIRFSGRGRTSRVPLDQSFFQAFRLREGKIAYCRSYTDEQEALEATQAPG